MLMPGRKYSIANTNYRYGFNGQEKSTEINGSENLYTAEYWEYDSRIGRRWNPDPVIKPWESPYAALSNNPIFNIDPNGDSDSTYKTPGGGTLNAESSTAETYDGKAYKVGNVTVQPAKGTLRSFRESNGGEPGETSRFVATFNTKSGEFSGYVWDGNMKDTYEDFSKAKREDIAEQYANADNPLYQHYTNRKDAFKSAINASLGVTLPNVLIRPLTIATNTAKVLKPLGLGSTGRTTAANLTEQLAMKEIMSNPGAGKTLIQKMTDASGRWDGWSKMSNRTAHGVEIHYNALWKDGVIKSIDDFKFIGGK